MERVKTVLVDTDIFIDFLRVKEKEKAPYFELLGAGLFPVISLITFAELYAGRSVWEKEPAREELEILLSGIEVFPLYKPIARRAGWLRANYNMGLVDALIAATALSEDIPLFTLNTDHFKGVENLDLYRPESA